MGNRLSEAASSSDAPTPHVTHQDRKRPAEEMIGGETDVEDVSPRRKRIRSTSDYIYETLFNQGADSDITIHALGTLDFVNLVTFVVPIP